MDAKQIHTAIETNGTVGDLREALLELLTVTEILATATLELNSTVKTETGKEALMLRSRLHLADFLASN